MPLMMITIIVSSVRRYIGDHWRISNSIQSQASKEILGLQLTAQGVRYQETFGYWVYLPPKLDNVSPGPRNPWAV